MAEDYHINLRTGRGNKTPHIPRHRPYAMETSHPYAEDKECYQYS